MAVSTGYITISDTLDGVSTAQIFTRSTGVPTSLPMANLRLTDIGFRFEGTAAGEPAVDPRPESYTFVPTVGGQADAFFQWRFSLPSAATGTGVTLVEMTGSFTGDIELGPLATAIDANIASTIGAGNIWECVFEGGNLIIRTTTNVDVAMAASFPTLTVSQGSGPGIAAFANHIQFATPVHLDGTAGSAATPGGPSGIFDQTESEDWYVVEDGVPAGTGRIWSRSAGYAGSNITPSLWRDAVAFQGADGAAGAPGTPGTPGAAGTPAPRYTDRRLYLTGTSTAPTAPSATITWSTGVLSAVTANWSLTAPTVNATGTDVIYFSDLQFADTTGTAATTAATGGTPQRNIRFDGIVTFNNTGAITDGTTTVDPLVAADVGSSGTTTIDGGRITAGMITTTTSGAQVGTGTTGQRVVMNELGISLFDAAGNLRVRIGDLTGL